MNLELRIEQAINRAKRFIERLTVDSEINRPKRIVTSDDDFFSWDNEHRTAKYKTGTDDRLVDGGVDVLKKLKEHN